MQTLPEECVVHALCFLGPEEAFVVFRHEGGRVLRRASETNGIFWLQEAQGVHDAFLGEGLHRFSLMLSAMLQVLPNNSKLFVLVGAVFALLPG